MMTQLSATRAVAPDTLAKTHSRFWSTLYAGWAASVLPVLLATVLIHAQPHARGIGFYPQLRLAIVAPACLGIAVLAAAVYRAWPARYARPRLLLSAALLALAIVLIGIAGVFGPSGLVRASVAPTLAALVSLAWFVPRWSTDVKPARTLRVVTWLFGSLELIATAGALAHESSASVAFEVPRALFDVEQRFLSLPDGTRLHYVDEGQGETLLFLHGNPAWSFQWRDLIKGMRGSARCVTLDYPGFGLSQAPSGFGYTPAEQSRVLEAFVDQLGLHDVTLVMQDWGGPIGLGLAGRRPELVRRVVLGSTWAWPTDPSSPRGIFSRIVGGPIGEFAQMNFDGFASLGIQQGIRKHLPADVLAMYLRPFQAPTRRGIAAFYPGQITEAHAYFAEVEAGLGALAGKPALIFWALEDKGFPRADLTRFERTFPQHKTIELANSDHFFFEDTADLMLPEMRAFLK